MWPASIVFAAQAVALLEVEGDRVTAADLARVSPEWRQVPPDTHVLFAPLPGVKREIGRAELERLAERHGLEPPPRTPEHLRIERRMRRLEATEAAAALAAALSERHRLAPDDVSVELIGFREPAVPAGELRFRSTGTLPPSTEPATVPLTWVTPDRRSATLWLRARVEVRGRYAVAVRRIEARQPLSPGDVTFEDGPLPRPPDRWRLAPQDLAGKMLVRAVPAGQRIARSWLVDRPAVERGAVVELELRQGPIELRVPGRAEQSGSLGRPIAFRNLSTGRRVTARPVSPVKAEVVP
jgi:flagella basal body P-ring formation protein FlgA